MSARWPGVVATSGARRILAERGGLAVGLAFYALVVAVLSALWRAAADVNGGAVAGYSAVAITWYLATSEAAAMAIDNRLIADLGEVIASGAITVELTRPASVLGVRVAAQLGRSVPRVIASAIIGTTLSLVAAGGPPRAGALLLAVPSLALAVTVNVLTQHAFAAAAFWLRDAGTAWFLYSKLVFVLGGMLIPIEVLPHALQTVTSWLPFSSMAYAPARLAAGHVEPWLLVRQVAWMAVAAVAALAAFGAGLRRLEVAGG